MSKTIEQQVEEFNKESSNDCVLGKYLIQFAKVVYSPTTVLEEENKIADKEINEWLTEALKERDRIAREEERGRITKELQSIPLSYTIKSHEEGPYESNYIDIEDLNLRLKRLTTPLEKPQAVYSKNNPGSIRLIDKE